MQFPELMNKLRKRYPQYEIGRGTYGVPDIITWNQGTTFKIGAYCSIAPLVRIFLGGEHFAEWVTSYPFSLLWENDTDADYSKTKGNVIVGNDVWIAFGATIMSGVTIGDGAVVGARSVVTKDIEPYAIYAGNPAQLVRKRFDDESIARLLELKWWDFDDEDIKKLLPLLLNKDVKTFLEKAEKVKQSYA